MNFAKNDVYEDRFQKGDKVIVSKMAMIEPFSTFDAGNQFHTCGAFSALASGLDSSARVGRYACVAGGLRITGFRHPIDAVCLNSAVFNFNRENIAGYFDFVSERDGFVPELTSVPTPQPGIEPIRIGHDVWIGENARISGGVTIGNGAVVASDAVVTKDVPPYSVIAGNPGKIRRLRFPKEICDGLNEIQWWNYELTDMHKSCLPFATPSKFIEAFMKHKQDLRPHSLAAVNLFNVMKQTYSYRERF